MAKFSLEDTVSSSACPVKIPRLGFGVYESPVDIAVQSILTALKVGYRQIDTAQFYENEAEVGQAVQQTDIPRKDIFITTKILDPTDSVENDYQKCLESIKKLDPSPNGYVDLFLIHSAVYITEAQRPQLWAALERLYHEGKAKAIGVSNFGIQHIEALKKTATVWPPHVNQIELHPWATQTEIVKYCEEKGIIVQAYCPIVRNLKAKDPVLSGIAQKLNVTPNQVLLRYSLQKNWIPLPKSDNPDRIKANTDLYHFELSDDDISALDALDQGAAGALVEVCVNE